VLCTCSTFAVAFVSATIIGSENVTADKIRAEIANAENVVFIGFDFMG
jgi:hypothetical protein